MNNHHQNYRLKSTLKVLENGITVVFRPCQVHGDAPFDRSSLCLTVATVQITGPEWSLTSRDLMMFWTYCGIWVTQRHAVFNGLIGGRLGWTSHRVVLAACTGLCSLTHPSLSLRITWVYRLSSNSAFVQAIFKIPFAMYSGSHVPLQISTWKCYCHLHIPKGKCELYHQIVLKSPNGEA